MSAGARIITGASALLVFLCLATIAAAAAPPPEAKVLILQPFDTVTPGPKILGEAITRELLSPNSPIIVETFAEYLDMSRFSDEKHTENLLSYLTTKYAGTRFDIVVALSFEALQFTARYRDLIAPGAKVVTGFVTEEQFNDAPLPANEKAGIVSGSNVPRTIELAMRLQPRARDIVIVSGLGPFDRFWADKAAADLAPLAGTHRITQLTGLTMAQYKDRVAQLDRNTIVLVLSIFEDAEGRHFVPRDAAAVIAQASAAPSYALYDTFVGGGVVGGYTDGFDSTGQAIAQVALDLLAGKSEALGLHPAPSQFRVDARQLERWGMARSDLPPETIVLFDTPSLWEEHGNTILAVLAVLVAQSLLLAGLLVQRRRRRRAEDSLRESEERMASAATYADIGLWHIDLKDGTLWATEHCRAMFGLDTDAPLTPASLLPAIHPDDRANVTRDFRAFQAGQNFDDEFRVLGPDGTIRWIQAIGDVRRDAPDGGARVGGVFKDITAAKEAELEAGERRREAAHMSRVLMLGELSGAIVHELNQPLAAILANAQAAQIVLDRDKPDVAEALAALGEIVEDDHRAGQVIQRLRRMLKRDQGAWETIDVNELARSTSRLVRNELVGRRIATRLELQEAPLHVRGDPIQLQQVALNLMINAMDALGQSAIEDREIVVSSGIGPGGAAELRVRDNGPGIAPEQAQRLFQPFFTTKSHGLGLGLSICQSIVKAHGGSLTLVSAADRGAVATVTLPAADALEIAA